MISGCVREEKPIGQGPGPIVVVPTNDLPPPAPRDLTETARPYLVGPNDKLEITVFGVPELTRVVQVDANGQISFPLIGTVEAAGRTPLELGDQIASQLRRKYVRDPQLTVNLQEGGGQTFTIDGQVTQPGVYPVVGKMSLMRAVAMAKGTTEFAKMDDVVIFRTVNGKSMAGIYNLGAIRRGTYADPDIYANDIVVMGDSKSRRMFKDLLTAAPALVTPLVVLLQ